LLIYNTTHFVVTDLQKMFAFCL